MMYSRRSAWCCRQGHSWLRMSTITTLLLAQQVAGLVVPETSVQHVLSDSGQLTLQRNVPQEPSKLNGKFLHVTDMHPDMFYKAHTATSEGIACHREQGPAGYYGAETSDCDSPVQLIDSVMAWIKENIKDEIDFVIWTGDSARHDSDEKIPRNSSQVLGTNKLMVKKMIDLFSDDKEKLSVPIIPSLGNNDILPHNILLPAPNKWLRTYTDVWKHFIPESQLHSFDNGGWFFTEVIPNKLAVFSVNTLYFFDRNAGVDDCERPSEPGFKQMEWMRIQLTNLRKRGVKAILTGHVPPARTKTKANWDETCWQRYNLWMNQFRDIIVGTIYGHMNIDHFLLHDSNEINIRGMTGFSESTDLEDESVHNEAASILSSANYLVDLRHLWSKLPNPKASISALDDEEPAEFSIDCMKPWKSIGNKYGERYHLSLVSPSVVPNYFPTIRIVSYNTTGLNGPLWREIGERSVAESEAFATMETIDEQELEQEIIKARKKGDKKRVNKGGEGGKGGMKKTNKDPYLVIPDPPAKGTPPGPAYSVQPLTFLGYIQYYANITTLSNNIKGDALDTSHDKDGNSNRSQNANGHELRSLNGKVDSTGWRSGPHKDKELHKNPRPLPFKFEVEYNTFTDKVYKLKDLTVKSYIKLAYRMAEHKPNRGKESKKQDVENVEEPLDAVDSTQSASDKLAETEEVNDDAGIDNDHYYEDEDEDDGKTEDNDKIEEADKGKGGRKKKRGKRKNRKGKLKKKNESWRQFLEFAFVKTIEKKKIDELDECR